MHERKPFSLARGRSSLIFVGILHSSYIHRVPLAWLLQITCWSMRLYSLWIIRRSILLASEREQTVNLKKKKYNSCISIGFDIACPLSCSIYIWMRAIRLIYPLKISVQCKTMIAYWWINVAWRFSILEN